MSDDRNSKMLPPSPLQRQREGLAQAFELFFALG